VERLKARAWLMLVLCNLFWAGNYVSGKYVVAELSPLWITILRWLLALLFLYPIAHFVERPDWKAAVRSWKKLLLMGLLGVVGYNLVLYAALEITTPTSAALVQSLNPALLVLFAAIFLGERVSRWQTAGFVLSLIGVLVILSKGHLGTLLQADFNGGDLLMLIDVLIWTAYSIFSKKLTGVPPITATAISTTFSVALLLPFGLVQGVPTEFGSTATWGVLYMALFPSVCSYIFWNLSVRIVGPSEAGVFMNLIPFFTAVITILLGEAVTGAQISGGLLVVAGVLLTTGLMDRRKKKNRQSPTEIVS
jgi:drug/metabolite transporter (DMT)-like permease